MPLGIGKCSFVVVVKIGNFPFILVFSDYFFFFLIQLRNLYAGQEATELAMGQQTGSKQEKEYRAVDCHPAYLTFMQSTS